jgi:hypothetical protein
MMMALERLDEGRVGTGGALVAASWSRQAGFPDAPPTGLPPSVLPELLTPFLFFPPLRKPEMAWDPALFCRSCHQ